MKKAVAIVLLLIFVPLFIVVTLYLSTSNTLLNAKLIIQKLAENNVYNVITEDMVPEFISTFSTSEDTEDTDETSDDIMDTIPTNISDNISAQWLQTEFEKLYLGIIGYLQGTNISKEIVVDLSPISDIFSTSSLSQAMLTDDFLMSQYESLPVCEDDKIINCRSEDLTYDIFKLEIEKEMEKIGEQPLDKNGQPETTIVPDTLNIYDSLTINDASSPNYGQNILDKGRNTLKIINTMVYVSIAIQIFIVIVIILMYIKQPKHAMKLLGTGFLITAIIILTLSALGLFASPIINGLVRTENASLSNAGLALLPFIDSIVKIITLKIVVTSGLLLVIAIILLIFAKRYDHDDKKKPNNKLTKSNS